MYHSLEDTWRTLPQPGVYYAVPINVGGKLTLIGGRDTTVYKFSAKILKFDAPTQSWIRQFPNLLTAKSQPGVVVYSHYLIVAGGKLKFKGQLSDEIEFLDMEEFPLCWKKSAVKLPTYMWDLTAFFSENYFWIIGYGDNYRRKFVHRIAIAGIVSSTPSAKKNMIGWYCQKQYIGNVQYYTVMGLFLSSWVVKVRKMMQVMLFVIMILIPPCGKRATLLPCQHQEPFLLLA